MNEFPYFGGVLCANFSHPSIGIVPVSTIPHLPLQERDLPDWFNRLPESTQEGILDRWWSDTADWLSMQGASAIHISIIPPDRGRVEELDYERLGKYHYFHHWDPHSFRALRATPVVNPDYICVVDRDMRLLISQIDTWDGLTTEQPVTPVVDHSWHLR